MSNVKQFIKNHKKELIITAGLVGIAATSILAMRYVRNDKIVKGLMGKSMITWTPESDKFLDLERVKMFLDHNANNTAQFAIFREGIDPNQYTCILLSEGAKLV